MNNAARRSNQSILKEISPGCSLEGLMLKLKLQYFATSCIELIHWKRLWYWEGLGSGGEGDDRGWDGWMASPTRWMWIWVNSGSWWWTGRPGMLQFMWSQRVGHDWATELNWTELNAARIRSESTALSLPGSRTFSGSPLPTWKLKLCSKDIFLRTMIKAWLKLKKKVNQS